MIEHNEWMKYILAAGIIVFGAIVHATNQLKIARTNKEPFTVVDFIVLLPISMFSGAIFGLVATLATDATTHIVLASGIGSFLGLAGLNRVADIVLNALVKRYEDK